MAKRKIVSNDEPLPDYILEMSRDQENELNFEQLEERFNGLKSVILSIDIPSMEEWEGMLVRRSLNMMGPYQHEYWWYFDFPGSDDYRQRVEEYNRNRVSSGLAGLENEQPLDNDSCVAIVLRGIQQRRISSRFMHAWGYLYLLFGRYIELLAQQKAAEKAFKRNVSTGAQSASIAQHVWYARWLLKHATDFERDRPAVEENLAILCKDIVKERRQLPDGAIWKEDWFDKLLQQPRKQHAGKAKQQPAGISSAPELIDRVTRLSQAELNRLKNHRYITADLLPPLDATAFPKASSSHP